MASWRWVALVGCGALGLFGCSGKSTSDDDDSGGQAGQTGSGGTGGSGATGGTGISTAPPPACGSLTSLQAREIATTNIGGVLRATVDATRFTEGSTVLTRLLNGTSGSADPFTFASDANQSIDDLVNSLHNDIFADGNVESQTDSTVTFHLTPAVNCPLDQETASIDPAWAAEDQQYCIDDLNAHPARYVVSRVDCTHGDAVSIALVVETARVTAGVLTAFPHSLVLNLDAADIVKALQAGGDGTDYDADIGGKGALKLDTSTTGKATFSAALATKLVVGGIDNGEHLRVTVDASPQAALLTAEASAGTLVGSSTLGAISVTFPFHSLIESAFNRSVTPSTSPSDSVDLAVPGLSGGVDFDRNTDRLSLTGLGLGQSTSLLASGGATLLKVDVNPANGRKLNVDLAVDANGELALTPWPAFELDLGYSMAPVASKVENLEPFALDDAVAFFVQGATSTVRLLKDPYGGLALLNRASGPEVRADAGSFAMTSTAFPAESVHVAEGQCLLFDSGRSGQHDILRGYFSGACQ